MNHSEMSRLPVFLPISTQSRMCPSAASADRGIGVGERAVLVALVLEHVGVDRADPNAVLLSQSQDLGDAGQSVREVPQHVDRHGRAAARELVNLAGIAQLLLDAGGGRGLYELAESGSGVGKSPGGYLHLERVQLLEENFFLLCGEHNGLNDNR